MRAAVVAGATGLTGGHLLNGLLDSGHFEEVHALIRRPMHRPHPRLQEHVVDFDALELSFATPVQTAFCCLGTTIRKAGSRQAFREVDHGAVVAFARWARSRGAGHFLVVSSVAAAPDSPNFYLRVKGETEAELETLGFDSLDIFQPSFLLGARAERRPAERVAQILVEALDWAMAGPLEKYRGIRAQELAQAMQHRAEHPEPGVHRHLYASIAALARSEETHAPPHSPGHG